MSVQSVYCGTVVCCRCYRLEYHQSLIYVCTVGVLWDSCVLQMLPLTTNVKEAYKNGRDDEQNFIQNLSLFLCTFLRQHGQLIDKKVELHENLLEVRLTR